MEPTPGPRVLLELAIASVEDAETAEAGGADRLELNSAFALGGMTPSLGMLVEVRAAVALPLMVMIRPRRGGFYYSEREFRVLRRDLDLAVKHGADGLVFGALTADGKVDAERCRQLVKACGKREAVFHRAFDVTPDPFAALDQLIELGFRRVMTSGQEESAYNGATRIAEVVARAAGRIEVLPAGGINRFNVADVLARTGCTQVHTSLQRGRVDPSTAARPHVHFDKALQRPQETFDATNPVAVADMRALLG
ncbi:MAG TPA: copper homeostasis protein CutC [Gemmataceae bacterium]|jgi:copper homeostasis protein|nr:copper homeostasis protein CutC [Gemmataceae bacterium]